jgi:hypothetical protein
MVCSTGKPKASVLLEKLGKKTIDSDISIIYICAVYLNHMGGPRQQAANGE